MKYIRFILFIALLGLIGCKTYEPLEVGEPRNLKVKALSESTVDLSLELPIRNPNIFRINVTRVEGSAFINDKKAGEIESTEKLKLPANSDKTHDVLLTVDYSDLLSSGMSVTSILKSGEVTLAIKGSLTAKSFLYRKELDFNRKSTLNLSR
ncbi:MAG: LEA type 2 family protein [Bacteroidota bacterium]